MNPTLEAFLRALALFLGVYFTTGWAVKSPPAWDSFLMIFAVIAGLAMSLMAGRAIPVAPPVV